MQFKNEISVYFSIFLIISCSSNKLNDSILSKQDADMIWATYTYQFENKNRSLEKDKTDTVYFNTLLKSFPYIDTVILDTANGQYEYSISSFISSSPLNDFRPSYRKIIQPQSGAFYYSDHSYIVGGDSVRNHFNKYCDTFLTDYVMNSNVELHPFIVEYFKLNKGKKLMNRTADYELSSADIEKYYPKFSSYEKYWRTN